MLKSLDPKVLLHESKQNISPFQGCVIVELDTGLYPVFEDAVLSGLRKGKDF